MLFFFLFLSRRFLILILAPSRSLIKLRLILPLHLIPQKVLLPTELDIWDRFIGFPGALIHELHLVLFDDSFDVLADVLLDETDLL